MKIISFSVEQNRQLVVPTESRITIKRRRDCRNSRVYSDSVFDTENRNTSKIAEYQVSDVNLLRFRELCDFILTVKIIERY